jgi:hypothetical protein
MNDEWLRRWSIRARITFTKNPRDSCSHDQLKERIERTIWKPGRANVDRPDDARPLRTQGGWLREDGHRMLGFRP